MENIKQEVLWRYPEGREHMHQTEDSSGWGSTYIHEETPENTWMKSYSYIGTYEEAMKAYNARLDMDGGQRVVRISRYLSDYEGVPAIQEIIRFQAKRD